jgi:formylglycine-generating enzyme required for sulfatase activity
VYGGKQAALAPVMTSEQDRTPGARDHALYDLMGNAVEWTLDVFRDDLAGQDEGWAQADGLTYRAVRGLPLHEPAPTSLASLHEGASYRDALCANGSCPKQTNDELRYVGFRCVRHAPESK